MYTHVEAHPHINQPSYFYSKYYEKTPLRDNPTNNFHCILVKNSREGLSVHGLINKCHTQKNRNWNYMAICYYAYSLG